MLSIASFLQLLKESFRDLLPIILVIVFFQLAIIQTVPENWLSTAIGLAIVGVGLAVFLLGLEVGIFPVGEGLASDFARKGSTKWIVLFAFMIGFGTTVAEPALLVIADKAASISSGRIDAFVLRMVVAFSVGFAIVLGVWRIIKGHPIHYYIISGYIMVVAATAFAPKEIVGLAYDLGGVTTSTVTVPLVAALGIGLASTIKGRNPVLDGFGLIAFASLFPMITVMLYGVITDRIGVKGEHEKEEIYIDEFRHAIEDANDMGLSTVYIDGAEQRHSSSMTFSAIHVIVPHEREEDALLAAKSAGARGVTIMNAHGMGLDEMDNFYNRLHSDGTDSNLMFVVRTRHVDKIIREVMNRLDITGSGDGIVYAYPISHVKGIRLKSSDL